jgi:SNF2 family DNA or RNA helicase
MGKFFKQAAELQPHQKRVLKKLEDTDRLLVYHGLGSGKTLTALAAGEKLKTPLGVIGPASLRGNFAKEKQKHKIKGKTPEYHSYNKPPTVSQKDKILVYDEAHRMGRLESQRSHYPDIYRGKKEIYLTGTPLRNEPAELIPLMRGLGVNVPRNAKAFNKQFIEEKKQKANILARLFLNIKPGTVKRGKNLDTLTKALKGRVDYHGSSKENHPKVQTERIEVTMTDEQHAAYKMVMKGRPSLKYKVKHGIAPSKTEARSMNAFLTASRQISNKPGKYNLKATSADAPKLNRAVAEIKERYKKDPNYKGVTYSAFLAHGVDPMEARLKETKIPHARFTGKTSKKDRERIVKEFNEGKLKHLLLSGAGGEGLDLKGTKLLQVLEPHWNDPTIEQVKGRVNRFKSHAHLPKEERKVTIQTFIGKPPKTKFLRKQHKGSDEYLEMLSKQKKELNNDFLNTLKRAS